MDTTQTGSEAPKRTFRLRRARMNADLTQVQLASLVHMSVNTLSQLENNEMEVWPSKSLRTLLRMAKTLEVRPKDLYNMEDFYFGQ